MFFDVVPISTYEMMIHELKKRETNLVPTTIAILLVNYTLQQAKDYIEPALPWLHELSSKDINFYLPGYRTISSENGKSILYNRNAYFFHEEDFKNFCDSFCEEFDIEPTFVPTLILFGYDGEKFSSSRKMIIDLSPEMTDLGHVKAFFDTILSRARKSAALNDFAEGIQAKKIFPIFEEIFEELSKINVLKTIYTLVKTVHKYRIQ